MSIDPELREELRAIERRLDHVGKVIERPWYSAVLQGLLQGAGIVTGTIVAIVLLGWILTLLGVIPGVGEIAEKLNQILEKQ